MKNALKILFRIFLGIFATAWTGLFLAAMAFLMLWLEPHRHLEFILPVNSTNEAWSLTWHFGIGVSIVALILVALLFVRLKSKRTV